MLVHRSRVRNPPKEKTLTSICCTSPRSASSSRSSLRPSRSVFHRQLRCTGRCSLSSFLCSASRRPVSSPVCHLFPSSRSCLQTASCSSTCRPPECFLADTRITKVGRRSCAHSECTEDHALILPLCLSGPYDFGGVLTNTNRDVVNGETVQKRNQAQKEMHW